MFIKFLDHDLRYGIGHAKKRLIVTFIMFFFLSIYHFWTLRIFELTDPQYLESPVTTADYFLALIGGCGKVNLISGAENVVVKKSRHEKYLFLICFFKSRHEEYFCRSCFFKSGHGQ